MLDPLFPDMSQSTHILLVLDANQRSALAIIRSLGRLPDVTIYAADSTSEAIGGSSKYCSKFFICPSISETPHDFMAWLRHLYNHEAIDLVIPVTEKSSQLVLMQNRTSEPIPIPFADYETVMSLAHKGHLTKLAESAGVHCPYSEHYSSPQDVDIDRRHTYPIVVKPCLSSIWQGDQWMDTAVQIAQDKRHLAEILSTSPWLQSNDFMLQRYIPGYGAGLFALYNHGTPVCFFSHKRLREKPPQGGVSVLSMSIPNDPVLLANAKKLLGAAKWHGIAMLEFRISHDRTPYLMEVNTRFWGSLQLAIDAGIDFPELLYRISFNETIADVPPCEIGVRLRWLLGDLDSLYLVLRNPRYTANEKISRLLSFLTPHLLSTRHEVNRLSDLRPAVTELKQYVSDLMN